jgi:hypothetical protein
VTLFQQTRIGTKLADQLVGDRGGEKCPIATLRNKRIDPSKRIIKRVLEICKTLDINFAQVQLYELGHISALLGCKHI